MRLHHYAIVALALGAAPLEAAVGDFVCRNIGAEITCTAAACEVSTDGFTPMSIAREGARLEVCAYSGCRSGRLDLVRSRGDLTLLHTRLDKGGPVAIIHDRRTRIASLVWGTYVLPLNCGDGK